MRPSLGWQLINYYTHKKRERVERIGRKREKKREGEREKERERDREREGEGEREGGGLS